MGVFCFNGDDTALKNGAFFLWSTDSAGVGLFLCLLEARTSSELRTLPEEERRLWGGVTVEVDSESSP